MLGYRVIGTGEAPPYVTAELRALIRLSESSAEAFAAYSNEDGVEHEIAAHGRPADQTAILRENQSMAAARSSRPDHQRM